MRPAFNSDGLSRAGVYRAMLWLLAVVLAVPVAVSLYMNLASLGVLS